MLLTKSVECFLLVLIVDCREEYIADRIYTQELAILKEKLKINHSFAFEAQERAEVLLFQPLEV